MAKEWARKFYRSKEWRGIRELCLKRDAYLCQMCDHPAQEVHHKVKLTRDNITDPTVSLNPNNLISLCRDCHFKVHNHDKLEGKKISLDKKDCDDEFMFDKSGNLIRKPPL